MLTTRRTVADGVRMCAGAFTLRRIGPTMTPWPAVIFGLPASGPMSPRPRTAVPLVTQASPGRKVRQPGGCGLKRQAD